MKNQIVYLNGDWMPISEAKVSVLDRGFIFGDGIYEVIPVYHGLPFRMSHHIARLVRSLEKIKIVNPHTTSEWESLIGQIKSHQDFEDQLIYIQVTRGVAIRGHSFPINTIPTVFMMANQLPVIKKEVREKGVACVSMEDQRWLLCDIKSTSLLGNVLAAQHAVEHCAVETIQWRDGFLTEASSSNVWIIKENVLIGPPLDHCILEGVRVELLKELCVSLQIQFSLRKILKEEAFSADEVLLTSATKEILAVISIDGIIIGNGKPGDIGKALYNAYQLKKIQT
jgi:D-alanine transaminase